MKYARPTAALVILGLIGALTPAQDAAKRNVKVPQCVLLIRHAEKTGVKSDIHLNKRGQERSQVLYKLFQRSPDRPDPFPSPDFIFAASHSKESQRPVETVTPLAMKLRLPIVDAYASKLPKAVKGQADAKPGMAALRGELFSRPAYFGKTILVSWRHSTISRLAETLKATHVPPKWPEHVFDRVWQIRYDDRGDATFVDRPQRLLPGDSER